MEQYCTQTTNIDGIDYTIKFLNGGEWFYNKSEATITPALNLRKLLYTNIKFFRHKTGAESEETFSVLINTKEFLEDDMVEAFKTVVDFKVDHISYKGAGLMEDDKQYTELIATGLIEGTPYEYSYTFSDQNYGEYHTGSFKKI
jgi:hypothetical protein